MDFASFLIVTTHTPADLESVKMLKVYMKVLYSGADFIWLDLQKGLWKLGTLRPFGPLPSPHFGDVMSFILLGSSSPVQGLQNGTLGAYHEHFFTII